MAPISRIEKLLLLGGAVFFLGMVLLGIGMTLWGMGNMFDPETYPMHSDLPTPWFTLVGLVSTVLLAYNSIPLVYQIFKLWFLELIHR